MTTPDKPGPPSWTYEDVMRAEVSSGLRHEVQGGQLVAMTGDSRVHAKLAARMTVELDIALRASGCDFSVLSSDARYRFEAHTPRYPDASVVCGADELHAEDSNAATNPAILVEVLSPSTQRVDRVEKANVYLAQPSLRAYVIVSQKTRVITAFVRREAEFECDDYGPGEAVVIPVSGGASICIDVDAVYRGILPV